MSPGGATEKISAQNLAASSDCSCSDALQDDAGNTHLHKAVSGPEDLPDLVAALLAVGVPGNATNKDGDTALHIAARAGQLGVGLAWPTQVLQRYAAPWAC